MRGRSTWWMTPAAMPQTKRDLGKLGVTSLEQLENPLPRFIRCKCKLALRKDDDGNEANRLKSFEVVGIDIPEADAFAPEHIASTTPANEETLEADHCNKCGAAIDACFGTCFGTCLACDESLTPSIDDITSDKPPF